MNSDTAIEHDIDWDSLIRDAARVGREVARDFPGIEASDVEQEILTDIAARKERWSRAGDGLRFMRMRELGLIYASRERYTFLHFNAEWVYKPAEVRALMADAFFDPLAWEDAPQKDKDPVNLEIRGLSIPLLDLKNAFEALSTSDQRILRSKYEFAVPLTGAEQKASERAIDKMTRSLNNGVVKREQQRAEHDGPGSRQAMSNESARFATANQN